MANHSIYIVGQGAIGLLLAKYLSQTAPITLIYQKLKGDVTFTYTSPTQHSTQFTVNAIASSEAHQISQLILPLKAHQIIPAFNQLKDCLTDDAVIVLSHNGMGTVDALKTLLTPGQSLLFLSTSMGAFKTDIHTLRHTGLGKTFIGVVQGSQHWLQLSLTKHLLSTLPDINHDHDINQLLWRKLLINIAINPLTALYQVKNGAMIKPEYCSQVFKLVHEAVLVANAEGITISLSEALELGYDVMRKTANNNSSMKQDFSKKQPTEIEAICGYVIKKGAQYQIATPFNQWALQAILDGKPLRS